jgi:hypothetical protein
VKPLAGLLAGACALSAVAHAEPGGTGGVSSPRVTEGAFKLEGRTAYFDGGDLGGNWAHRAQANYGFNDWYQAALIARGSDNQGVDADLNTVAIENVFEFTATEHWPVQFGGLFEYAWGFNGAGDSVTLKLLAQRRAGNFDGRLNLNTQRDVGDDADDDWTFAYAARGVWEVSETIALGFEGYGEPENEAHYWGPRGEFRLGEVKLAVGYIIGLDEARADSQFRVGLEWSPN